MRNRADPQGLRSATMIVAIALGGIGGARAISAEGRSVPPLGPAPESDLILAAPIDRWDEAIPLGNGLMGGLLWGGDGEVRLSLDRGDLWDLRTPEMLLRDDWTFATIRKLVAAKDQAKMVEMFDQPYNAVPYPTKIPAGRLVLSLDPAQAATRFRLDLRRAIGRVEMAKSPIDVFFSAAEPIAMIRASGSAPRATIIAPASLSKLGYAPPETMSEGNESWTIQEAALGLKYAVAIGSRRAGDATEIALTIASTRDGPDPLGLGRARIRTALDAGFERMLVPHIRWWARFWSASGVGLPEPAAQQHYDLIQYFYGAASRRGAPPIPLQGVWTADEAGLPPWHGDYHNDLNTQLTYWPYLAAGHLDEGLCFLDFLWDLLPEHRRFAKRFYDAPGAAVPGVMTLDGKPMGGWGQYSLTATQGGWVAQAFYLHWKMTCDPQFLAERAYPYCAAIGECLAALLAPAADGKLKLPLSSSPEIHDNSLAAWLAPNSNYDLAILRWLFGALAEMADARNDGAAAARWRSLLDKLDPLAVEGEAGALRISPAESLPGSHRHHSHLMAIHPLGLITIEGSERDRKIIEASLAQLDRFGTAAWCGYSFSWRACIAARAGDAEGAWKNLDIYLRAFITRNGFHVNGDFKRLGYSSFTYRPFTLEGNFAAAQAVQEMLLQSWGGTVRIFPAVPARWGDVSFRDLRAEGGFRVSAARRGSSTDWVRVASERGGTLRLRDPFGGRNISWSRPGVEKACADYTCVLGAGEALEGTPGATP